MSFGNSVPVPVVRAMLWAQIAGRARADLAAKPRIHSRRAEPALRAAFRAELWGSAPLQGSVSHISLTESKRGRIFPTSATAMELVFDFFR